MSCKFIDNALNISKDFMDKVIKKGDIVVDATVGNGNDTLYMAGLVGDKGKVYGFDIQKEAIAKTKQLLKEKGVYSRVKLINDGHENMDKYIKEKVKLIVFNLGFLPGGDKSIITRPDTTLKAIKRSLNLLVDNGLLLVVSYSGHSGGLEEAEAVKSYLSSLNQQEYNVLQSKFINQINNPPVLYGIEKKA